MGPTRRPAVAGAVLGCLAGAGIENAAHIGRGRDGRYQPPPPRIDPYEWDYRIRLLA